MADQYEDLKQLSVEHLNEAVKALGENNVAITIAEVTKDKDALLKLRFQRQSLQSTYEHWRTIVNEEQGIAW